MATTGLRVLDDADKTGELLFQTVTDGATHVRATIPSTEHPQAISQLYTGTGVNDNDVLFTTGDVTFYNSFTLMSTAGAVDVVVSLDGSTYSTTALSLHDLGDTTAGLSDYVAVTSALRVFKLPSGKYNKIRVLQNGVTAATAHLLCGVE